MLKWTLFEITKLVENQRRGFELSHKTRHKWVNWLLQNIPAVSNDEDKDRFILQMFKGKLFYFQGVQQIEFVIIDWNFFQTVSFWNISILYFRFQSNLIFHFRFNHDSHIMNLWNKHLFLHNSHLGFFKRQAKFFYHSSCFNCNYILFVFFLSGKM